MPGAVLLSLAHFIMVYGFTVQRSYNAAAGLSVTVWVHSLTHLIICNRVVKKCADLIYNQIMVGAHVVNHNKYSIGICYEGGLNSAGEPEDTRTPEQKRALREKLEELHRMFPKALIVGHRDLNPRKECPCYEVMTEYRDLEPL